MNQLDTSLDAIDHFLNMPLPSETIEAEKEKIRQILIRVAIGVALNVLALIAVAIMVDPLFSAKILLIEIMLAASLICLGIAFFANDIMDVLKELEALADMSRDQLFVELNMVREQMESLRLRLVHDQQVLQTTSALPDLLKSIGPLAMLLLKRETNPVSWGMVGWKVAQNAMAFFKERTQKPAS